MDAEVWKWQHSAGQAQSSARNGHDLGPQGRRVTLADLGSNVLNTRYAVGVVAGIRPSVVLCLYPFHFWLNDRLGHEQSCLTFDFSLPELTYFQTPF